MIQLKKWIDKEQVKYNLWLLSNLPDIVFIIVKLTYIGAYGLELEEGAERNLVNVQKVYIVSQDMYTSTHALLNYYPLKLIFLSHNG